MTRTEKCLLLKKGTLKPRLRDIDFTWVIPTQLFQLANKAISFLGCFVTENGSAGKINWAVWKVKLFQFAVLSPRALLPA